MTKSNNPPIGLALQALSAAIHDAARAATKSGDALAPRLREMTGEIDRMVDSHYD